MRKGLVLLCLAYVLSQFFRAFLAVLTQLLQDDIGATADDLAFASGMLFLSFAAMQIPVGEALDRVGPRLTAAVLLAVGGGGGAALFAIATSPLHIALAMALIWWYQRQDSDVQAIIPYAQALALFPNHLQQLICESNGKSVTQSGAPVLGPTSPVVFGQTGIAKALTNRWKEFIL